MAGFPRSISASMDGAPISAGYTPYSPHRSLYPVLVCTLTGLLLGNSVQAGREILCLFFFLFFYFLFLFFIFAHRHTATMKQAWWLPAHLRMQFVQIGTLATARSPAHAPKQAETRRQRERVPGRDWRLPWLVDGPFFLKLS